ncbi:hypothetical protein IMSAGC013_03833 [Lachnospiraceae bacterium]|nr:hypothetical protein IMSAGC013_03833 [Lachnospiraceae bacterium]
MNDDSLGRKLENLVKIVDTGEKKNYNINSMSEKTRIHRRII